MKFKTPKHDEWTVFIAFFAVLFAQPTVVAATPAIVPAIAKPSNKGRLLRSLLRERPGLLRRILRRKRLKNLKKKVQSSKSKHSFSKFIENAFWIVKINILELDNFISETANCDFAPLENLEFWQFWNGRYSFGKLYQSLTLGHPFITHCSWRRGSPPP